MWLHLSLAPLEAPDDLLMFCCGLIFILLTQRLKVLTQQMCEEMNTDVFVFVCFFTASIQQTQCPAEHLTGNPQSQVRCRQPETTSFPCHSLFYPQCFSVGFQGEASRQRHGESCRVPVPHHLLVNLKSFTSNSIGEDTDIFFSLFDLREGKTLR